MSKVTIEMETDAWIWLCEVIQEIKGQEDFEEISVKDAKAIDSVLEALIHG